MKVALKWLCLQPFCSVMSPARCFPPGSWGSTSVSTQRRPGVYLSQGGLRLSTCRATSALSMKSSALTPAPMKAVERPLPWRYGYLTRVLLCCYQIHLTLISQNQLLYLKVHLYGRVVLTNFRNSENVSDNMDIWTYVPFNRKRYSSQQGLQRHSVAHHPERKKQVRIDIGIPCMLEYVHLFEHKLRVAST